MPSQPQKAPASEQHKVQLVDGSNVTPLESKDYRPQAVLYIVDNQLSDGLSAELGANEMNCVQVDDIPTVYAVVNNLRPEVLVVDPSLCSESAWRDLQMLRKFTLEQDCMLMVLLNIVQPDLLKRLRALRVDQVALITDPIPLQAFRIRRLDELRRELVVED
ncbi:MAG: hypothetical protein ACFCU3_08830 [Verrucomicrobiales bacterium]